MLKRKFKNKYNYENLPEDAVVVKNWEPLKFEIKDNYKYISENIVFNCFSNIFGFITAIILTVFNKIFYGYKIKNKNKILKNTGFISISNHIHQMDCTFIALSYFPRRVYFPTLASNFKIPVVRHIIKLFYAIPIPKKSKQLLTFYNKIINALKKGKIVHMYPEGSLWPYYDKIRNFKEGAFKMAVDAGVPIQPVIFKYKQRWYKIKPAIICEILDPIYPNKELKRNDCIKDLKNRCLNEMRKENESINTIL